MPSPGSVPRSRPTATRGGPDHEDHHDRRPEPRRAATRPRDVEALDRFRGREARPGDRRAYLMDFAGRPRPGPRHRTARGRLTWPTASTSLPAWSPGFTAAAARLSA